MDHNLENLFTFIDRRLNEQGFKVFKFNKQVFGDQINDDNYFRRKILEDLPKSSDMYKVTKAIDDNIKNKINSKDLRKLEKLGIKLKGKDMAPLIEKVHTKYPMVSGSRYRVKDDEIIAYCKQMDKLEKLSS